MRDLQDRQRSYVFPDTVRNTGGFWRGISTQKLKGFQWLGLFLMLTFQIGIFALLLWDYWPEGSAPWWRKIVNGYGPYALLALPLIVFFVLLKRSLTKKK